MSEVYRVRAVSTGWTGGPGLNTFYFAPTGVAEITSEEDALLCRDRVRAAFADVNLIYPPATTISVQGSVDVIETTDGELTGNFSLPNAANVVGAGLAGYNALATMLLLRWNTNDIMDGHRVKGRSFLGPVSNGVDADGTPQVGLLNELTAFGTAMMDIGVGEGPKLCVWHRPRPATEEHPVAREGQRATVISYTAVDKYAVLRSRRD